MSYGQPPIGFGEAPIRCGEPPIAYRAHVDSKAAIGYPGAVATLASRSSKILAAFQTARIGSDYPGHRPAASALG